VRNSAIATLVVVVSDSPLVPEERPAIAVNNHVRNLLSNCQAILPCDRTRVKMPGAWEGASVKAIRQSNSDNNWRCLSTRSQEI
jgi:hypothetical protein